MHRIVALQPAPISRTALRIAGEGLQLPGKQSPSLALREREGPAKREGEGQVRAPYIIDLMSAEKVGNP